MAKRDLICVGASAGGVPALIDLSKSLPADLAAAVLVVLHLSPEHRSVLPRILSGSGRLPAHHPGDGEPLLAGRIYVAPPDQHLLVEMGRIRVVHSARENGHRPAVDPLFRTAALAYGPRVIGVVLTGALDDGAAGLWAVKQRGGLAVVEDPETAFCPDMPRHALEVVSADHVASLAQIGQLLPKLVGVEVAEAPPPTTLLTRESEIALRRPETVLLPPGEPSSLACPGCGGVLNEVHDQGMLRFGCRSGHAYGLQSLIGAQQMGVEAALWAALRALEEQGALGRRMEARARGMKQHRTAKRYGERAEAAEDQALLIRRVLGLSPVERDHG